MDFIALLRVIARRWLVVIPILIATIAGAVFVGINIPPEYTASITVLAVDTPSDRSGAVQNITPPVLAEIMQDGKVRSALTERGATGDYRVSAGGDSILRVTSTARTEDEAVATTSAALEALEERLESRQSALDIPEERQATIEVLNVPATASRRGDGFEATGSARLVSGEDTGRGAAFPPETARILLVRTLQSTAVADQVAAQGGTESYSIGRVSDAPILTISASGNDPQAVAATVSGLVDAMDDAIELVEELADAPINLRVTPIGTAGTPEVTGRGGIRAMVAIGAAGLMLAIALALLVETVAHHHASRQAPPTPAARRPGEQARPTNQKSGTSKAVAARRPR